MSRDRRRVRRGQTLHRMNRGVSVDSGSAGPGRPARGVQYRLMTVAGPTATSSRCCTRGRHFCRCYCCRGDGEEFIAGDSASSPDFSLSSSPRGHHHYHHRRRHQCRLRWRTRPSTILWQRGESHHSGSLRSGSSRVVGGTVSERITIYSSSSSSSISFSSSSASSSSSSSCHSIVLHSSHEPREFSQWPCGHDDNTVNIVLVLLRCVLAKLRCSVL